jgi:hypothetical protein
LAPAVPLYVAERTLVRKTGRNRSSRLLTLCAAVLGVRAPFRGNETEGFGSSSLTWCCCLAINASAALVVAAVAANASRIGYDWASRLFYLSIAILFMPVAARLALPHLPRSERIVDLMIAALGLFALRVIRAPIYFIGHDEYLHGVTAQHIMENGRLFTPSVLFPVGPSFPGLEIVTAAIAQLSGVSIFAAAIPVLAAARILFVGALFLIYERMTRSARVGALGCIFYMGASTFVFFDTYFSYESLALALLALALLLDGIIAGSRIRIPASLLLLFALVALGLAMTHHVTAYAVVGILAGVVTLEALSRGPRNIPLSLLIVAACAFVIPLAWSNGMGNPVGGYLGPVFENALKEALVQTPRARHSCGYGSWRGKG